jgi:hypothetical protein
MIPKAKQHVKCIMRTGAMVEGIVQEWTPHEVQLLSLDAESILIIPHPAEDIMLIKIIVGMPKIDLPIVDKVENTTEVVTSNGAWEVDGEIAGLERKFQEAKNLPSDDPERLKTLAELRILMAEQEKKIITEKMRNHYPSETRKVQYGYPGIVKKPSPK